MDDNELYPIGDVARRTGLSISAIRFYANAGVITPTGHTDAGYRLYDIEAIARLELVRTLRELGASLDDVRRLLADETTLRDLAMTHLAIVERETRRLRARRAVLRTIVKQDSPTEQVSLMHKLVSMSDDDRERLIDEFWDEVTDGLNVHPAYVEVLHQMRPDLPEEPTAGQLEAWIELADLVQDDEFRRSVRQFFHDSLAHARARELTEPARLERIEKHRQIQAEVQAAQQAGVSADSPEAQDIVNRLVASMAELTGETNIAEVRRRMAGPVPAAVETHVRQAVSRFTGLLGRFMALNATINGTPQPEAPADVAAIDEWVAAALTTPGSAGPKSQS